MRFLCLILLSACVAKKANTAAVDNAAEAPQPETTPSPASDEEAPAAVAEQSEAASDPAVQEQPASTDPQPEKEPCTTREEYTLNMTAMMLENQPISGMIELGYTYRGVTLTDGQKHVISCLNLEERQCRPGACTNYTKCCDRGLYEPKPVPEAPKPAENTAANQPPNG